MNPLDQFKEEVKAKIIAASHDDNAKFYPEAYVTSLTAAAMRLVEAKVTAQLNTILGDLLLYDDANLRFEIEELLPLKGDK